MSADFIGEAALVEKMRDLRAGMLYVGSQLVLRGDEVQGAQLHGAAGILDTWIAGVREEIAKATQTGGVNAE